jgi:hypothetical protein
VNEVAAKALFDSEVARLSPRLLAARGWEITTRAYPLLEVVFRRDGKIPNLFSMRWDGWSARPPAVDILTPERTLPQTPLSGGIFNASPHPITGRPFICMAGVREYHTHSSHLADFWDGYRTKSGYDLGGITTQIWNGWLKLP